MDTALPRREFLATCAAGVAGTLAGCADPDVAVFVDPVPTDRAVAERATLRPDRSGHRPLVAEAVDGGTDRPAEPGDDPPFDPDRPVVHDGSVYDLEWTATGREETRTEHAISVTVHDDGRAADATFDVLPELDRDRLANVRRAVERAVEENHPLPAVTVQHHYTAAERNRSALVPDPRYDVVRIEGRPASIEVSEETVALPVLRYTARERAATLAAFGAALRSRHRLSLSGLGGTERDSFESVRDEGSVYEAREGFEGVADRLVAEPAVFVEGREGEWLVAYEGGHYWVTVDFVRMPEYADRLEAVDDL